MVVVAVVSIVWGLRVAAVTTMVGSCATAGCGLAVFAAAAVLALEVFAVVDAACFFAWADFVCAEVFAVSVGWAEAVVVAGAVDDVEAGGV